MLVTVLDLIFRILVLLVIPALVVLVKQIFALRQAQALLDQRTCALEKSIQAMPGEKGIHDLSISIADLNGEFKSLRESMNNLGAIVARHEDFLWNRGGGR